MAFLFLFGGSGFSLDIAKCCDHVSGISLSFRSADAPAKDDCCIKVKAKSKKSCCSEQVIQMVINPVLGIQKAVIHFFKVFEAKPDNRFDFCLLNVFPAEKQLSAFESFDHCYPIPVLLRKRVLQI